MQQANRKKRERESYMWDMMTHLMWTTAQLHTKHDTISCFEH